MSKSKEPTTTDLLFKAWWQTQAQAHRGAMAESVTLPINLLEAIALRAFKAGAGEK